MDGCAAGATAGDASVVAGAALDVVEVSQVATQDEGRGEGQEQTEQPVQDPVLAQPLGVLVALAGEAERSAATYKESSNIMNTGQSGPDALKVQVKTNDGCSIFALGLVVSQKYMGTGLPLRVRGVKLDM